MFVLLVSLEGTNRFGDDKRRLVQTKYLRRHPSQTGVEDFATEIKDHGMSERGEQGGSVRVKSGVTYGQRGLAVILYSPV